MVHGRSIVVILLESSRWHELPMVIVQITLLLLVVSWCVQFVIGDFIQLIEDNPAGVFVRGCGCRRRSGCWGCWRCAGVLPRWLWIHFGWHSVIFRWLRVHFRWLRVDFGWLWIDFRWLRIYFSRLGIYLWWEEEEIIELERGERGALWLYLPLRVRNTP